MKAKVPDKIPDMCGKCTHYEPTGLLNEEKGKCNFYEVRTRFEKPCYAFVLLREGKLTQAEVAERWSSPDSPPTQRKSSQELLSPKRAEKDVAQVPDIDGSQDAVPAQVLAEQEGKVEADGSQVLIESDKPMESPPPRNGAVEIATTTDTEVQSTGSSPLIILGIPAMSIAIGALVFVLARQTGWTLGKLYASFLAASLLLNALCVLLLNPVVIARRIIPGAPPWGTCATATKSWDVVWILVFIPALFAVLVVALRDLNMRNADLGSLGIAWLIGASISNFGWIIITWSMVANPFFETTVRIQAEHGHHVIDSGPYAYIRHPGYVGFSAVLFSVPILLASAWTFLPALIAVVLLVIRTVFEDRTLQAELTGYAGYASRVRFRLIPGVW